MRLLTIDKDKLGNLKKGELIKPPMSVINELINSAELTEGIVEGKTALSLCLMIRADKKDNLITNKDGAFYEKLLVTDTGKDLQGYFLVMDNLKNQFIKTLNPNADMTNVVRNSMMLPIGIYLNDQGEEPTILFHLIIKEDLLNSDNFGGTDDKYVVIPRKKLDLKLYTSTQNEAKIYLNTFINMEV